MAVSKLQRLTISADDGESIDFELYLDGEDGVTFAVETSDGESFELNRDEVERLFDLVETAIGEYEDAQVREYERRLSDLIGEDDAA